MNIFRKLLIDALEDNGGYTNKWCQWLVAIQPTPPAESHHYHRRDRPVPQMRGYRTVR